jgi:hypothetical protein
MESLDALFTESNQSLGRHPFTLEKSIIEREFQTATLEFGHSNDLHVIHKHDWLTRRKAQAEIVGSSSSTIK